MERVGLERFPTAMQVLAEHAELEQQLADPAIHSDPARSRKVGRRFAELGGVVSAVNTYAGLADDLAAARELAAEDDAFTDEADDLEQRLAAAGERLAALLAPRDPNDSADAIVEIKSGEGGEESALFARDLFEMYQKYVEGRGWKVEVLDDQPTDLGGFKSLTFAVKANQPGDLMPYGLMKFEGGVHRVQRVPVTESQGRIHTSAAGVLVMPEVEATDVEINDDDLRIDVFRASGPGGQGVNTTDSAVRITHLPTGIVVSCQNERSQLQNKESALRMLRSRLIAQAEEEAAAAASDARKSQVRTVDRSERIRTYNFPENRITDHRIGFKAHNLDQVLAGDMSALVGALQAADLAERLGRPAGSQ
ncbi:peptide chain release factor 1 [Propionibacteriaceae bacterium G57]|uniref:peptide chain release factor 1 n=1 Tax=Aestuariimicrobium sp. G57 TaxID=3418485 RepID=UPI003DA77E56